MRGRVALLTPKVFARPHFAQNSSSDQISFRESFWSAMRPRVAFSLRPLRFLQLLPNLVFLVANVLQVTLEKRQLRCLRIRRVAKSLVVLTSEVRWSRFLRLTDTEK